MNINNIFIGNLLFLLGINVRIYYIKRTILKMNLGVGEKIIVLLFYVNI